MQLFQFRINLESSSGVLCRLAVDEASRGSNGDAGYEGDNFSCSCARDSFISIQPASKPSIPGSPFMTRKASREEGHSRLLSRAALT